MAVLSKFRARWSPLYIVILVVLGYIVYITVNIEQTPPDGAPTPQELASEATQSIAANDVDRFSRLLDYPTRERHDFAENYLTQLHAVPASSPVTVSYPGEDQVEISTNRYQYRLKITQNDKGNWELSLLPPTLS